MLASTASSRAKWGFPSTHISILSLGSHQGRVLGAYFQHSSPILVKSVISLKLQQISNRNTCINENVTKIEFSSSTLHILKYSNIGVSLWIEPVYSFEYLKITYTRGILSILRYPDTIDRHVSQSSHERTRNQVQVPWSGYTSCSHRSTPFSCTCVYTLSRNQLRSLNFNLYHSQVPEHIPSGWCKPCAPVSIRRLSALNSASNVVLEGNWVSYVWRTIWTWVPPLLPIWQPNPLLIPSSSDQPDFAQTEHIALWLFREWSFHEQRYVSPLNDETCHYRPDYMP